MRMKRKRAPNHPNQSRSPSPSSSSPQTVTEMDSCPPSIWQSPEEFMLEEISRRLETRTEVLHLRAVCSDWRKSCPLPPKIILNPDSDGDGDGSQPLKLPFPIGPNKSLNPSFRGHFLLRESIVYCMKPWRENSSAPSRTNNNNWFVNIEDGDSGKVRLKDPFDKFTNITNLDKNGRLPNKVINLLDYRVREVGKTHFLEFVQVGHGRRIGLKKLKSISMKKVVVGRNNLGGFWVMVNNRRKLGFWKMGEEKWTQVDDGLERPCYVDIVFHNGKIHALDYTGLTIAVDPSSLQVTEVASGFHPYRPFCRYLVSSLGDLLLVDIPCQFYYLKVHKLDEQGKWIPLQDIGDQAMLVGDGCCYSVLTKGFAGFKRNRIYFSDGIFGRNEYGFPGCDVGFIGLTKDDDDDEPLESGIFWPPPTWLGQTPS